MDRPDTSHAADLVAMFMGDMNGEIEPQRKKVSPLCDIITIPYPYPYHTIPCSYGYACIG
jgi:hypothetical protein